jgi:hypothetical protein
VSCRSYRDDELSLEFTVYERNKNILQPFTWPLTAFIVPLITNIPPSQISLLLSDSIPSRVYRLGSSFIESAVLSSYVESVSGKDNKEDEVAGEYHTESGVEVWG